MQCLGCRLREVRQLLDLRDHRREACREVRDLLKAKLKEIRSKIRHLEELERELTFDLQNANGS
jgi:DNA-binding transcriptional MerR regulator